MSTSPPIFTLEGLRAEIAAAEAAETSVATPPVTVDASAAPTIPTPTPPPTATSDTLHDPRYVDLDTWGSDAPTATPPSAAADGGYETRYRVLQGKYDAEVPRLQARIRELEAQHAPTTTQDTDTLRLLQSEVASLRNDLAQAHRATAPETPAPTSPDLDDELSFEYGDAGARVIRELRQQVTDLQQQTQARIESIEARDANRTRDAFRARLLDRLGEDRGVFDEPGWAAFVQQRNPYAAGHTYNASLLDADAAGDLDTILNIVNAYRDANRDANRTSEPARTDPFDALAVPAHAQAGDLPSAGQRFRMGDLDRMIKKWQHGEKTFAELQSFERAFNAAHERGLVDP